MDFKIDETKPTICHVSWLCCPRVQKEMLALRQLGYPIKVIARKIPYEAYAYIDQKDIFTYSGLKDLPDVLRSVKAHVYHVHSEPAQIITITKEVTQRPTVYDCHDADPPRGKPVNQEEQDAFDSADAVIHVSEPYGKILNDIYGYRGPSSVLYSYVNGIFYNRQVSEKKGTLVYEGGASPPVKETRFSYRNFTDIFKWFIAAGYDLTAYITDANTLGYYASLGVDARSPIPMVFLIGAMSSYKWGVSVFPLGTDQVRLGIPNKYFDYMAAGIPVIATEGMLLADLIKEHGTGIAVDYSGKCELPDPEPYAKRVLEIRDELTMERHIGVVEDIYRDLLGSDFIAVSLENYDDKINRIHHQYKVRRVYPGDKYLELVKTLEQGFGKPEPLVERKDFSLRHDVDRNIVSASMMARFDADNGIRSSFYFLPTAQYLLASLNGKVVYHDEAFRKIKEIQDFGHEVGLHNDLISIWLMLGQGIPIEVIVSDILDRLRGPGCDVKGTSSHGSELCGKFGFVNYNLWGCDKITGYSTPISHKFECPVLDMADYGLEYDADTLRWLSPGYLMSDGRGGKFWLKRRREGETSETVLADKMDIDTAITAAGIISKTREPGEKIQLLIHPENYIL